MKKILHIIATPRGEKSRTLEVSQPFLKTFQDKSEEWMIEEVNLFEETLPAVTAKQVDGKFMLLSGRPLDDDHKKSWEGMLIHIEKFLSADLYVMSVPMWNFGIPYILKHYIDVIVQPGYLFRYTDKGPEGLIKDKKIIVVTSRGGDYNSSSPFAAYDQQEPYLRTVLGFIGFKDIHFIHAQPMDAGGDKVQMEKIKFAQDQLGKVGV